MANEAYAPASAPPAPYYPAPGTEYAAGAGPPPPGAPGYYPPQPQPQGYAPQQGYPQPGGYQPQPQYDARGGYTPGGQYGAPAPQQVVIVHNHKHKEKKEEWAPLIIFIIGWFFCPVWCAGWCYLSKKHNRTARIFGAISAACAVLNAVWIVIVIAVAVAAGVKTAKKVQSCADGDDVTDCY